MNGKGERERLGPAAGVCLHTGPVVPHFLRSQQAQPAETALVLSVPAVAATAAASGYHPAGRDKMKWKALVMAAILQAQLPVTEAQSFGLLDPKLCYLLDGILFLYGVIVTALFLRVKFSLSAAAPASLQAQTQLYNELNLGRREEYDVLDKRRGRDPEMGGKQRRKNPQDVVYNVLQKDKMAEAYSEIGLKGENQRRRGKGHEGLYQGLSTATKDTYDALHMQALPPR
ncbi:T-cell surface glycoprotein CD3 zeta chain isoform X2 [Manis pentadactyla]|uniref:T-cell surface glycoprotein CD3 zeta chain isoform X2 n=2 Tax=Manis TaxID=9973 RepID=UPI0018738A4A|nr:T-cell surface glycoprotein CD3 zeta chain isoform X2 [Manis pentadactyla]